MNETTTRESEVDAIMAGIPERWRYRWCKSELCACLGCVYTGNKQVIAERITGEKWWGDAERISEHALREHPAHFDMLAEAEWEAWKTRNPQPPSEPTESGVDFFSAPHTGHKWPPGV